MVTCVALVWLLVRRNLDPRMAVIYAWCPLPIVEFAIEGHLDIVAIAFMVAAVVSDTYSRPGSRVVTGFLIAMAVLTRLYPVLLLPLLLRRRDWSLLVTFLVTVCLGYLPFSVMGHGQVLGFLTSYAGQQGGNAGIVQAIVRRAGAGLRLSAGSTLHLEYAVDAALLVLMLTLVLLLRLRQRISVETAILLLIGTVFAISSHVFPWYLTALLPWVAISVCSLSRDRWSIGAGMVTALAWWFACTALLAYMENVMRLSTAPWWTAFFYSVVGLLVSVSMAGTTLLVYIPSISNV